MKLAHVRLTYCFLWTRAKRRLSWESEWRQPALVSDQMTLTFRARRRNHIVSTPAEANTMHKARESKKKKKANTRQKGDLKICRQRILTKYALKHRRAAYHASTACCVCDLLPSNVVERARNEVACSCISTKKKGNDKAARSCA